MAHSGFDIHLERDSDVPLGTQLAWQLRAAIAGGSLRSGDRLPPVRELAATAGVNVNTVRAVYARLRKQGVIDSEQGRGTFVARSGATPDLGELIERSARDAQRHHVDPRDLAALLYARFDRPAEQSREHEIGADVEVRRALRAEIEALEHELATLEPQFAAERRSDEASSGTGARLLTAGDLEATRDALSDRVSARRRQLRAARAKVRERPVAAEPKPKAAPGSAWPELLVSGLRPMPGS